VSPGYDVPPPDEVTADWWAATRQRRLLLQVCTRCDRTQHPPRALCTGCGATDHLEWRVAAGMGTIDACTVVELAPSPAFVPPYVVARVRLAEGPVLLTNVVDIAPYEVSIGDEVWLRWRELPDGRALPVFGPASVEPEE
jgi:uncharacterized OB-fold protein